MATGVSLRWYLIVKPVLLPELWLELSQSRVIGIYYRPLLVESEALFSGCLAGWLGLGIGLVHHLVS
jgi:hypothetical protein